MELMKEFSWEGSHILPKHPGKCARLHGHSFKLRVYVSGIVNEGTGFVIDYLDIKKVMQSIIDNLDHKHLGTWYHPMFDSSFTKQDHFVEGMPFDFYPSSENLIVWVANQIGDNLDYPVVMKARSEGITTAQGSKYWHKWSKIELDETCTSSCILTREEYDKQAGRG